MTQQPSGVLSFGTRTGAAEYWQGALRHVRVYSRCLCAKEIAELAGNVGAWKLDEISGITAADSSPAVNNGTYINGPTIGGAGPTTDTKAAQFDGSNDYVNLPANVSDYSNGLTIAAWAYPTATGAWARFVGFGGGEDQYNFFLSRVGTTSELELGLHGGTLDAPSASAKRYVRASNAIVQNAWHHYAATISSAGVAKVYKDAVELTISSGSTGYPTIGLPVTVTRGSNYIARSSWAVDDYYQGKYWDVRVYSRCLCPAEIQALYDVGASTFQGVKIIKWVEIQ
jgi:hypothetical protein